LREDQEGNGKGREGLWGIQGLKEHKMLTGYGISWWIWLIMDRQGEA